jgi:ADP-ribose pyrophosphatase
MEGASVNQSTFGRHGPWQILDSHEVYRDPWIDVRRDNVTRPDGKPGTHCVVRMKAGVSVLPLDDEGFVYLTEEFHYAIGRVGLEAVSGGMEPGESPQETAQRELEEELGVCAEQWTSLGSVDPFTTIIVSPVELFLARGLRFVPSAQEGTEQIRLVKVAFAEAVQWVMEGKITHAPTCVLILKSHRCLQSAGK